MQRCEQPLRRWTSRSFGAAPDAVKPSAAYVMSRARPQRPTSNRRLRGPRPEKATIRAGQGHDPGGSRTGWTQVQTVEVKFTVKVTAKVGFRSTGRRPASRPAQRDRAPGLARHASDPPGERQGKDTREQGHEDKRTKEQKNKRT